MRRLLIVAGAGIVLAGCAGPTGSDVACVRQKLGGENSVSMPVAAQVCGHVVNGRLAPLDLHGASDLQVEAKNNHVAYTP